MLHDARALAATYVLAVIAAGCLLMAILIELLPAAIRAARVLPPAVIGVLFVCAAASCTPLVLGTSLVTGFLSAYCSLPVVLAALALAVRFDRLPSPINLALLGLATSRPTSAGRCSRSSRSCSPYSQSPSRCGNAAN